MLALNKGEKRGKGIMAAQGIWKTVFNMTLVHENQVSALISRYLQ